MNLIFSDRKGRHEKLLEEDGEGSRIDLQRGARKRPGWVKDVIDQARTRKASRDMQNEVE